MWEPRRSVEKYRPSRIIPAIKSDTVCREAPSLAVNVDGSHWLGA